MAFDQDFLGKASSSGNINALQVWGYNGLATGANDTNAAIVAAGYFNNVMQNLTTGAGPLKIGDILYVRGNDTNGMYIVTAVTTNVTVATFAAVGAVGTANLDNDAVTTVKILDANVTTAKIANDNVTTAKIADDNVTNAKLAEDTVQYAEVTVSTAEILALAAAPKTVVAAPGLNRVIQYLGAELILDYAGVQYTEGGENMAFRYTDGDGVIVSEAIESTGFIDAAADTLTNSTPKADVIVTAAGSVNQALVLDNTGGSEYALGTSPVLLKVTYKVITTAL